VIRIQDYSGQTNTVQILAALNSGTLQAGNQYTHISNWPKHTHTLTHNVCKSFYKVRNYWGCADTKIRGCTQGWDKHRIGYTKCGISANITRNGK